MMKRPILLPLNMLSIPGDVGWCGYDKTWKGVKAWLKLCVFCVMNLKNRSTFTDVGDVDSCVVRHVLIPIGGGTMSVRRVYSGNGPVRSCVNRRLMRNGWWYGRVYVVSDD